MVEWDKNKIRNEKIKQLLSEGNSISSIAKNLKCSKSTVYYYAEKYGWWHNNKVTKNISNSCKAATTANKTKWNNKRSQVVEEAIKQWPKIKKDPRLMGFLGLYWGEGGKRNGVIQVVNNDPGIIKFCFNFIKENVDNKIEVVIRCYPEQDETEIQEYWSRLLKTEVKTKEKKWLGKKRKCWSEYGICYARTSDWKFYLKIITWIGLWRAEITNTKLEIDTNESISRSGLFSTIEYN